MANIVDVILQLQDKFSGNVKQAEGASKGLLETMHQLNGAMGLVERVGSVAMGAFNSTIKEGIALNSKYAQTQIQIAGTLKAFDLTKTFQEGKQASSAIYGLMEELAAPLPGSVDDYVNVFQKSLPGAIKAFQAQGGGSMKDIANFTSRFAAVAIANNVDAAQAAADIPRLLGGQAGADVIAYGKLQGLIEKSAKDMGLAAANAEQFNKLKPEQRLAVMQKVVEGSKDTIDAYSNTLDAQEGTLESVKNNFLRTFSSPVYDAALKGLTSINGVLDKNKSGITALAQLIGTKLGAAIEWLGTLAAKVFGQMETMFGMSANALKSIAAVRSAGAAKGGEKEPGGAVTVGGADGINTILTPLLGLLSLWSAPVAILVSIFTSLASNAAFVDSLLAGLSTLLNLVVPLLAYLGTAVQLVGDFLAALLIPIILGAVQALTTIFTYLMPIFGMLVEFLAKVIEFLKPPFVFLIEAIMALVNGVVDFLMPIITILVAAFTGIADIVMTVLGPPFNFLAFVVGSVIKALGKLLSWLGNTIGEAIGVEKAQDLQKKGAATGATAFKDMFKLPELKTLDVKTMDLDAMKLPPGEGAKAAAKGAKAPKQRAGTVNDFRGSKFDITQKFAEGFDPDRIAAAFTEDLSRMADMRLDSSLATPFTTR